MKNNLLFLFCIFCIQTTHSQIKLSAFDRVTDSLVHILSERIIADFLSQDIEIGDLNLWEDSQPIIGEALILEAVKDSKTKEFRFFKRPVFLYTRGVTEKFRKKEYRSFNRLRRETFQNYVDKYYEYPHELFDYLNYKFIVLRKEGAVYGKYRFKVTAPEDISIVDKEWKILSDPDIEQIWHSEF